MQQRAIGDHTTLRRLPRATGGGATLRRAELTLSSRFTLQRAILSLRVGHASHVRGTTVAVDVGWDARQGARLDALNAWMFKVSWRLPLLEGQKKAGGFGAKAVSCGAVSRRATKGETRGRNYSGAAIVVGAVNKAKAERRAR